MEENIEKLKCFICSCLEDKKAENIIIMDNPPENFVAQYMILANGRSVKNVRAIAEYISLEIKNKTDFNVKIEGFAASKWVVIDAGPVLAHIFHPEERKRYNLEELWR